jgi:serpin B
VVHDEFIPAAADFTVDVFQRSFAESGDENVMVSPLSVLLALAMTANGADGVTLQEMEAVLGRGITLDELNKLLSQYADNLPSEEGSKLNIANSIWFRDDEGMFVVNEDFLRINEEYYHSEIFKALFDQSTVNEINNWVSRNTDEMITQVITEIPPLAIMYLINAIVFDSEWEDAYGENDVRKRGFNAINGEVQTTDFMWSDEEMFIAADNATGFVKPYAGGHYSFAALLPNRDVNITDFIADMTGENLMNTLNHAYRPSYGVRAALPKFTFEYEVTMNGMLAAMGMPSAFVERGADFTRIGTPAPGENIFMNRVLHKTFIEVDEVGTRAAAVTVVEMNTTDSVGPMPEYVILDRPFVFAIVDNATNLPIFIGALMEIPE